MPSVTAFCDSCGTPFSSGLFFENSFNITLSGNRSGPCPNCGGMGHVPDGVFNFIGSTIEILSAPQRTIEELTRLAQILRDAKTNQQSTEQVSAQIKQELPGLSSLAELLPKNRGELYGFLAVVLAAIQLLTQSPQPAQNITINVSQVFEQTLESAQTAKPQPHVPQQSKEVGRNEPCPCGSGQKYKKCCGKLK
jgi:hypothetical protein